MTLKLMATLGDSITYSGTDAGKLAKNAFSYAAHAEALTNGAFLFRPSYNKGVSGETIAQVALRVSQVTGLSPVPEYCAVLAGTNDLTSGTSSTAQQMADALAAIGAALLAGGVIPIFLTVPYGSDISDAQNLKRMQLNEILRTRFAYAVADGAALMEELSYPDDLVAITTFDGTHPELFVQYECYGRALAATYMVIEPGASQPTRGTNYSPIGVSGFGGVITAPALGAPATGWNAAGAALVAKSNRIRGWVPSAGSYTLTSDLMTLASMGSGLAVGDKVYADFVMDLGMSEPTAQYLLSMRFYTAANALISTTTALSQNAGVVYPRHVHGRFRIGDFVVPATAAKMDVKITLFADVANTIPTYFDLTLKAFEIYKL